METKFPWWKGLSDISNSPIIYTYSIITSGGTTSLPETIPGWSWDQIYGWYPDPVVSIQTSIKKHTRRGHRHRMRVPV